MNDYIRKKDVLAALNGLLKDINENRIGDGASPYLDGIWKGEKACAIEAILRILKLPAEDVNPVVRGTWDDTSVASYRRCSECGCYIECRTPFLFGIGKNNYCPNCGADMRGEENNYEAYLSEGKEKR